MQITQTELSLFLEINLQIVKPRNVVSHIGQLTSVVALLLVDVPLDLDIVLSQLVFFVSWRRCDIHCFDFLLVLEYLDHAWDDHLAFVVDLLPGRVVTFQFVDLTVQIFIIAV